MHIDKNPFCRYDLYAKSFVRNLIGPPVILNILSNYSQVRAKVVVVEILEIWLRRRIRTEEFMEVLEVEENDVFEILLLKICYRRVPSGFHVEASTNKCNN